MPDDHCLLCSCSLLQLLFPHKCATSPSNYFLLFIKLRAVILFIGLEGFLMKEPRHISCKRETSRGAVQPSQLPLRRTLCSAQRLVCCWSFGQMPAMDVSLKAAGYVGFSIDTQLPRFGTLRQGRHLTPSHCMREFMIRAGPHLVCIMYWDGDYGGMEGIAVEIRVAT